jgi:hypothetical protein
MSMLGTILSWVGAIGMLIFGIQILILAFKTSIGWGLASLLIPFVVFFYVAKNWPACRTPFLRWVVCLVISVAGAGIGFAGVFSSAGG